jgi:DNA-binding HxlR family transcriptional regulator
MQTTFFDPADLFFHLFGGKTLRFSHLERAIPGISQKMLTQQLRQLGGPHRYAHRAR